MAEERSRLVRNYPTDARRYTKSDEVAESNDKQKDQPSQTEAKSCCKYLSFMEVQLLILLILAALIIILLAVLIIVIRVSSFRYCTTAACAHQAGMMLAAMNTSADPCDDFYNYACGHWNYAYATKPGVGKYSNFYRSNDRIQKLLYQLLSEGNVIVDHKKSISVDKALTFFKACNNMNRRNEIGVKPVLDLITKLGGWTITTKPALRTSWDFLTTLIEVNNLGMSYPLSVFIGNNPYNSSQHVLELATGTLFFSSTEMKSTNPKFKAAFMSFGRTIAKLIGDTGTPANLTSKLEKVWAFEKDIAEHEMSQLDRRNPQKTSNILTVKQVQDKLIGSAFSFTKLLKSTFGYDFKGTEKVLVSDLKKVKHITQKIKTMDKEVLANYIVLQVMNAVAGKLSYPFEAAKMQRRKAITGSTIMIPTWKVCVELTKSYFPLQLTAMYVDKFFNKEDKKRVKEMVLQIKDALKHLISSAKWMDSPTRKVALDKLKYLQPSVAYPDDLFDFKKLDEHFASIHLNVSNFFQDYLKLRRQSAKHLRALLLKPVDRKIFTIAPITANAYYSQTTVTIKILLGIIINPFYDHLYYHTSNLGALGSVIGHEMNHGFDSRGQQYDQRGNLHAWWSNETRKRFLQHTKCFIDQYSKYTFHGLKNKGGYTVAENIADNGGMEASLLAFKISKKHHGRNHGYLPGLPLREKQLFFLAFAQNYCGHYTDAYAMHAMRTDVHSVYRHRVLGVLSNQKEFAEAFQCPKGSTYNPSKRCVLW